jgi:hypothetical protein
MVLESEVFSEGDGLTQRRHDQEGQLQHGSRLHAVSLA